MKKGSGGGSASGSLVFVPFWGRDAPKCNWGASLRRTSRNNVACQRDLRKRMPWGRTNHAGPPDSPQRQREHTGRVRSSLTVSHTAPLHTPTTRALLSPSRFQVAIPPARSPPITLAAARAAAYHHTSRMPAGPNGAAFLVFAAASRLCAMRAAMDPSRGSPCHGATPRASSTFTLPVMNGSAFSPGRLPM